MVRTKYGEGVARFNYYIKLNKVDYNSIIQDVNGL